MEKLLSVRQVSCGYVSRSLGGLGRRSEKPVLHDINLEIAPGEILGLVGESGCGKTTLGKCALGLIDYSGEILVDGLRQGTRADRKEMAKRVQAVFQDPSASLNPAWKTGWILEEPLRINKMGSRAERRRRVDEILELAGLDPSYKNRRVHELSVGQKQRICVACALMPRPRLIIADEAVSALDVSVGAQILNLFRELHHNLKLGMLFISHNLNMVYYLCDRIAVMKDGRIVEQGAAEEIYSNPRAPCTRALLETSAITTRTAPAPGPL
ncbi:MAG: ATP-binding cassette domain-containing protein [Treponema sp.]|jgi:ABC-type glutathione transport system ATPase component|nr:ATP-binding cassette domain-containing protein [Treponema sp.]